MWFKSVIKEKYVSVAGLKDEIAPPTVAHLFFWSGFLKIGIGTLSLVFEISICFLAVGPYHRKTPSPWRGFVFWHD